MAIRLIDAFSKYGGISGSLQGVTAALVGDYTPPAVRTGTINRTLGNLTASFRGQFVPDSNRTGVLAAAVGAILASFRGQVQPPSTQNRRPEWTWLLSEINLQVGVPVDIDLTQVNGWQLRASDPDGDPMTFDVDSIPLPPGLSLSAAGRLTGTPTLQGTYEGVRLGADDGFPEPVPTSYGFSEIHELVFINGIAETIPLGQFVVDPNNPWVPGDLEGALWTPAVSTVLRSGGLNVSDSWLTCDPATLVLAYSGQAVTGAARDYIVYLESPTATSMLFRIRILNPTHIYGVGTAAADKVAEMGWTGRAMSTDTDDWNTGSGSVMLVDSSIGLTDATPRVVYLCSGTYPYQGYNLSENRKTEPSTTTYIYICGDPVRPLLTRPEFIEGDPDAQGLGQMGQQALAAMTYFKNLDLWRITISMTSLTSSYKSHLILLNVRQQGCNRQQNGIGTSFDYHPDPYPGVSRTPAAADAVDSSPGTYFKTWMTQVEGRGNGGTGNTTHQMYIEGNGATYLYLNNCLFAGARGCSTVKSITPYNTVRNCLIAAAPDFDSGYASETDSNIPWADKLLDIKGAGIDLVVYNNDFRCAATSSKGTLRAIYWRNRQTAYGSNIPPYPGLQYSPPLTRESEWGEGTLPISGFSQGVATFTNPDYWASAAALPKESIQNTRMFRKFVGYNTFRVERTPYSTTRAMIRDDGTHPIEVETQFSATQYALGVPEEWLERSVTHYCNNRFPNHQNASQVFMTPVSPGDWYIAGAENGSGNVMRSYTLTWNDGVSAPIVGRCRLNEVSFNMEEWSQEFETKFLAYGFVTLDPPDYRAFQARTLTHTRTADPGATGFQGSNSKGLFIGGVGSQRDVTVTISGTWTGTVTLQSGPDDNGPWTDLATWTGNVTGQVVNDGITGTRLYRIGFKAGEGISGAATMTLSHNFSHIALSNPQLYPRAKFSNGQVESLPLIVDHGGNTFGNAAPVYVTPPAGFLL